MRLCWACISAETEFYWIEWLLCLIKWLIYNNIQWLNSFEDSSSKNKTPLCARLISPGWGKLPPPTIATILVYYLVDKKFLSTFAFI